MAFLGYWAHPSDHPWPGIEGMGFSPGDKQQWAIAVVAAAAPGGVAPVNASGALNPYVRGVALRGGDAAGAAPGRGGRGVRAS